MFLRPLSLSDAPLLPALHALCFKGAEAWSLASFSTLLQDSHVTGWGLLNLSNTLQGMLVARVVAGEGEILTLAIHPACRRQGGATNLLQALVTWAEEKGIAELFLEVAEDNIPAQTLYARHGFRVAGRRPHYYGPGREGLILRRVP